MEIEEEENTRHLETNKKVIPDEPKYEDDKAGGTNVQHQISESS